MSRPRHLVALGLGAAACVASVGLVLAQDYSGPPPPPPGYVLVPNQPGPPGEPAPTSSPAGSTVAIGGAAPPPEEAAPPASISAEANTPAQPLPDVDKKVEPLKRPRFTSAILQAVDKTTAETLRFEAKVGEPVRYKGLVVTVHACEASAADEGYADSMAHLDVQAQPEAIAPQASRVIFRGWMFADSPGLHAVEHPLYDVWLIACKTAAPPAAGAKL